MKDYNPVRDMAIASDAERIAECAKRKDEIDELGLCYVCMVHYPCICEVDAIVRKMREYFDKNPKGDHAAAKNRNWGQGNPVDEMLRHLYFIVRDELVANDKKHGYTRVRGNGHEHPDNRSHG